MRKNGFNEVGSITNAGFGKKRGTKTLGESSENWREDMRGGKGLMRGPRKRVASLSLAKKKDLQNGKRLRAVKANSADRRGDISQ